MREKIYSNPEVFITENKELIDFYISLNSNSLFADTEMFKKELFDFSARVRNGLRINNVISFTYDELRNALAILTYDIESKADTTYEHGCDEQGFYIYVERPKPCLTEG